MGREVDSAEFTAEDHDRYREKLAQDLVALRRLLDEVPFAPDVPMTGLEVELNLVDRDLGPAMRNREVLDTLHRDFTTELGRWNIELNLPPRTLGGSAPDLMSDELAGRIGEARAAASRRDARICAVGTLPTLTRRHLEGWHLSDGNRYRALNDGVVQSRGGSIGIDITGPESGERLQLRTGNITPESACTSLQLHLQVRPEHFAAHYNAAQALAGAQLVTGANSPYLAGIDLWAETRIPLFVQATDTRDPGQRRRDVRPRVWFGERWAADAWELFDQDVRYFPALLPVVSQERPLELLDAGRVPELPELKLLTGTVYRWNRAIYEAADPAGPPHLRVENRVLPAGPTVADIVANACFFHGAVHELARQAEPVWHRLAFADAERNLLAAARLGIGADLVWPDAAGRPTAVPGTCLVRDELLPLADAGLAALGVARPTRDHYLGIVEGRCRTGVNGAAWQRRTVRALEHGAPRRAAMPRGRALREMLARYLDLAGTGEPVHAWPVADS